MPVEKLNWMAGLGPIAPVLPVLPVWPGEPAMSIFQSANEPEPPVAVMFTTSVVPE
jgi:hypothetical protein